jgi:ABC-type Fe3+ transport system permease subunit
MSLNTAKCSNRAARVTKKLLLPALWAIVSLLAMLFEPVSLADFGVVIYFGYYLFFTINAVAAASQYPQRGYRQQI